MRHPVDDDDDDDKTLVAMQAMREDIRTCIASQISFRLQRKRNRNYRMFKSHPAIRIFLQPFFFFPPLRAVLFDFRVLCHFGRCRPFEWPEIRNVSNNIHQKQSRFPFRILNGNFGRV